MKTNLFSGCRGWVRGALALCFLLLTCLPARAGGVQSGNSNSGGGDQTVTGGGEEVVGLPVVADTSGITLVGSAAELRSLAITLRGQGRVVVLELPSGAYAVTFAGTFRIDMDRAALARARVLVLFRSGIAFTDGRAVLELGDTSSFFQTPGRLPLPLARLAQSRDVAGLFLKLHLFGADAAQAHVLGYFGRDRVSLFQGL